MADDNVDGRQEFLLPSIGDGADEARIINWRVAVGDWVILGRPMCTVEAGGIVRELASPFVGQVTALAAAAGETVAVGNVLVAVADEDAEMNTETDAEAIEVDTEPAVETEPEVETEPDVEVIESEPKQARPKHSPLVRRLADEFEIDLATVEGTGAGGRITRDDVHRAAFPDEPLPGMGMAAANVADDVEPEPEPGADVAVADEVEVEVEGAEPEPDSQAEPAADVDTELDAAAGASPVAATRSTFSVGRRADAGQLLRAHERLVSQSGQPVSLDALLLKLVQPVVAEFAEFAIDGAESDGIGFCRSAQTGMVTDVVVGAGALSLQDIDLCMKDLERSHLAGDEPIVAPLTILDAGALGATAVTPPLPVGGIGCVAFGEPEQAVQLVNGVPQASSVLMITGTFDERAIQLGRAAELMDRIAAYIEDPILAFAG